MLRPVVGTLRGVRQLFSSNWPAGIDHTLVTGPHRWYTAVGLRLSLTDDGLTFGPTHQRTAPRTYHTTPVEAAEVANEAQAKLLVMYHLNPPPPARLLERIFARGVDEVREEGWILADDGTLITLPADSELVEVGQL